MIDTMRDIRDSLEAEIAAELGVEYRKLAYLENIDKNSFRTNNKRYGVRALAASEVPGVTKNVHITQSYEVVLTQAYLDSNLDDVKQVERAYDNQSKILDIYKRMVNNKGGLPGVILNIQNLVVAEPEYNEEEKVAVQRATIDITYRFSLI